MSKYQQVMVKIFVFIISAFFFVGCERGYKKENGKMYYEYWPDESGKIKRLVENVDSKTFEVLKGRKQFAKDKNHVYFRGIIVEDANPETFRFINECYSSDDRHVFYNSTTIMTADPNTFEILEFGFSKDKDRVFYKWLALPVADAGTFVTLQNGYAKDDNHVYSISGFEVGGGEYIEKLDRGDYIKKDIADAKTFQLFDEKVGGSDWGYDKEYYYYSFRKIECADYNTFELINKGKGNYAKDKYSIIYCQYSSSFRIEGADPATFEIENEHMDIAKDKDGYYKDGIRTDYDNLYSKQHNR